MNHSKDITNHFRGDVVDLGSRFSRNTTTLDYHISSNRVRVWMTEGLRFRFCSGHGVREGGGFWSIHTTCRGLYDDHGMKTQQRNSGVFYWFTVKGGGFPPGGRPKTKNPRKEDEALRGSTAVCRS